MIKSYRVAETDFVKIEDYDETWNYKEVYIYNDINKLIKQIKQKIIKIWNRHPAQNLEEADQQLDQIDEVTQELFKLLRKEFNVQKGAIKMSKGSYYVCIHGTPRNPCCNDCREKHRKQTRKERMEHKVKKLLGYKHDAIYYDEEQSK